MAFDLDGFYADPRGAGVRFHTYTSEDSNATVRVSGYFNDISDILNVRDVILVVDTATPTTYLHNVLTNASGVVDVSDGLQIPETDTD